MASDEKGLFSFTVVGPLREGNLQKNLIRIVGRAVQVAHTQQSFKHFLVYLQIRSEQPPLFHFSQELSVALDEQESDGLKDEVLTGRVAVVTEEEIRKITKKKADGEANARVTPGHKSYQPSSILSTDSCVVAIGSQSFCGAIARFHLEDIAKHHGRLIDTLDKLLDLKPLSGSAKFAPYDTLVISIEPDKKNYLFYNMNWLAEKILPPKRTEFSSVKEVLAHHNKSGNP
ncbi:MAG: hypothetical protein AAB388_02940 [Patescibacteria group bacterium]